MPLLRFTFQGRDDASAASDAVNILTMLILVLSTLPFEGVMAAKNQTAFFAVIILPMLEVFVDGFPGAAPLAKQAKANVAWWKTRTADNYSVQDLSGYSSAMVTTMARMQRGSLRDWPTILDRETGVWLQVVVYHLLRSHQAAGWRRISTRRLL